MQADFQLLEAWRDGDKLAGNTLFERHFLVVCNFFRNKVADGVDDLIQRTFVTCLEVESNYRGDGSFRAYLLGVARRVLLRHFREQARDGRTFAPLETSVCDLDPSPSALVAQKHEHARLLEGLRRLPVDLQIALELYFWESLNIREIAVVLDVPQGTAASRLRRAKELLGVALAAAGAPPSMTDEDSLEAWAAKIRGELQESG